MLVYIHGMTKDIRTRILDAAVQLLETEGAKAFGQTRVARAAGVKQGNITYHFPKKADLVAAVVERVNERRAAELEQLFEHARTLAPDELRALLFERLPAFAMEVKRSRVMLALLVEAEHDAGVATLLTAVTARQRAAIGALLNRAPDDLDLELVMAMISGISLFYAHGGKHGDHRAKALLRRFGEWLPTLLPPVPPVAAAAPAREARPRSARARERVAAR